MYLIVVLVQRAATLCRLVNEAEFIYFAVLTECSNPSVSERECHGMGSLSTPAHHWFSETRSAKSPGYGSRPV
jgi:hypothetical protein